MPKYNTDLFPGLGFIFLLSNLFISTCDLQVELFIQLVCYIQVLSIIFFSCNPWLGSEVQTILLEVSGRKGPSITSWCFEPNGLVPPGGSVER